MAQFRMVATAALVFTLFAGAALAQQGSRYIVQFTDPVRGHAALVAAGATIVKELAPQNAAAAHIPDRAVKGLQNNPHIEYIEADPIREPLSETTPYGISMVEADDSRVTGVGAGAEMLCIIDSGYYGAHEDLSPEPAGNVSVSGSVSGYPSDWQMDGCGHGTHVAGTATALMNNDTGVQGVLSDGTINIFVVRVFGDDCRWAFASDLIEALNQCITAEATVVNMSLGGSFKSRTEERAFRQAFNKKGILSVAAAGNGGNSRKSYPASYNSVISVAAIDQNKVVANFSQQNDQVELSAPGVAVLSTVPWIEMNILTVDSTTYQGDYIENAARSDGVGGLLVDGGLCDSTGSWDWDGAIVLCERGNISFFDKVLNVHSGGGDAAVIYNNQPGNFLGTLGAGNSSTIPAISLSQEDGQAALVALVANPGQNGTVVSQSKEPASGYEAWDGTSMATPHVSGVAALVWSQFPACSNQQLRDALDMSAEDLGAVGRDNVYGFGLVQAGDVAAYLLANSCDDGGADGGDPGTCTVLGDSCSSASDCCSNKCKGRSGAKTCK